MSFETNLFRSFLTAYKDLKLRPEDFQLPDRIVREVIIPYGVDELEHRLEQLHRMQDFEQELLRAKNTTEERHRVQVNELKKDIHLNQLRMELFDVERIFEQSKQSIDPLIQRSVVEKIEMLKKEIEKKS